MTVGCQKMFNFKYYVYAMKSSKEILKEESNKARFFVKSDRPKTVKETIKIILNLILNFIP
jgi:hypothetical protein